MSAGFQSKIFRRVPHLLQRFVEELRNRKEALYETLFRLHRAENLVFNFLGILGRPEAGARREARGATRGAQPSVNLRFSVSRGGSHPTVKRSFEDAGG